MKDDLSPAQRERAVAAPPTGLVTRYTEQCDGKPDDKLQPVGVHRSQPAVAPRSHRQPRGGGRGNQEGMIHRAAGAYLTQVKVF